MDIIEKILEINCSINKYDFKDDNDVIGIIVNKNDTDMFNGEGYAFLIDKRLNESDSKLVCAMLYKKLIYTGVTRAKSKLILLGDAEALDYGVKNTKEDNRKTNLSLKIKNRYSIK